MAMHDAYSKIHNAWAVWRGWLTAFFVALFLLSGAAAASGRMLGILFGTSLALLVMLGMLAALYLVVRAVWKVLSRQELPFSFSTWVALSGAVLLGLLAMYVIPLYGVLYASFGADLPASTMYLWQYHYLLLAPALAVPLLLYWIKRQPRRERYAHVLLSAELLVLMLCIYVMSNLPHLVSAEAVSG